MNIVDKLITKQVTVSNGIWQNYHVVLERRLIGKKCLFFTDATHVLDYLRNYNRGLVCHDKKLREYLMLRGTKYQ